MHTSTRHRLLLGATAVAVCMTGVSTALSAPASTPPVVAVSATHFSHGNLRNDYVPASSVAAGAEIHGITLTQPNRPFGQNLGAMPELTADGVNTVDLVITEYQKTKHSNQIFAAGDTPTRQQVEAAVAEAHQNGMQAMLMPMVWTEPYAGRKNYVPSNPKRWFRSYRHMMNRWAAVAQASHVKILSVGSEYSLLEHHTHQWRHVIRSARHHFSGTITYMATAGSFKRVGFWRSVDEMGISPYYTLSTKAVPRVRPMVKTWRHSILPGLYGLSHRYHRPILFAELGYESVRYTANQPYEARTGTPSEQAQANAYQATIDAVHGVPWLRGVFFFDWGPKSAAPQLDTSFEPVGKQAECVMAKSWAPSSAGTPTACAGLKLGK